MIERHAHSKLVSGGTRMLTWVEMLGLLVIAIATLIAGAQEVLEMVAKREVSLADLLLLFIYLEVLAMVGVYLESGSLPIRMPLYIAMVALARHLILDMKNITELEIIATSAAILIIAAAVLVTHVGHMRITGEKTHHQSSAD
ncbi:MAG: phosphate-starvation-inducible E [Sphingobacteriia bacterium]|nr:phosphate-starvation-inducible E [Sphingobacteriia bacterium]NCC38964.1 phosphate-starvation-inducible E [Gammaproteobacteria bacterium]